MPLRARAEGNAIYSYSSYGPIFGNGHDLCTTNAPNSNNCTVSLNNTYHCPTGQNANTFLTGYQYFTVSDMEIFGFSVTSKRLIAFTELEYGKQAISHHILVIASSIQ